MCGIAGAVGPNAPNLALKARRMRDGLRHRGPDSEGELVVEGAALAVRRLRVIDLQTGDQPQSNEDETVWTVMNGEIYNFRELREALTARGHRFRSSSDTEVIPHLYEDHGPAFVARLEGMFALAVWDARTRMLLLARDRMGKKPLLYRQGADGLTFASEHAALLSAGGPYPEVDLTSIVSYLRLGYVPAPGDAFRGVRKLPPASVLNYSDGRTSVSQYWSLPQPRAGAVGHEEAVEEIRRLLRRAVARRLVADVPIGAFLSGGLDSSAVVATMAQISGTVRTFTIDFADAAFSEAPHARLVAERFGTEHHEFTLRVDHADVLERLVRHYGEPFADSSAIPTYHVSRLARSKVTVALNGDGGDEVFAGYDRYVALRLAERLSFVPRPARDAISALAHVIPTDDARSMRIRRFLEGWRRPMPAQYLHWIRIFGERDLDRIITPELLAAGDTDGRDLIGSFPRLRDAVSSAQIFDLLTYLPDDLLVKVDIASMANSLEVRSPLLDRELVEFVIALPVGVRMPGFGRKTLLREAMKGTLPDTILRRKKHGFSVPIGEWLRGPLRSALPELLLDPPARDRGYFHMKEIRRLIEGHLAGTHDHAHRLWSLLMLEMWHRAFIDAPSTAELRRPA